MFSAYGAGAGKPVMARSTGGASPGLFLFPNPFLDSLCFHFSKEFDEMLMVGDAVYHVNALELLKPFAGKFIALEAPGHPVCDCAFTKPVAAAFAMRGDPV